MSNELESLKNNPLKVVKQTLSRQNEQGDMLMQVVDYIEDVAEEFTETKEETSKELSEIKEVQNQLEKQITLTRGEQGRLKSAVLKKSKELTYDFFKSPISDYLYNAKRGHTISYIWIVLKNYYDVATYPEIPHVEFENTMAMVNQLTIHDFPKAYYKLTPKMQEPDELNSPVEHVAFRENSDQYNLA